jgi:hypothetical protein
MSQVLEPPACNPSYLDLEIWRVAIPGKPRRKVYETQSQPTAGYKGIVLSPEALKEFAVWRIAILGQPRQIPYQWKKAGQGGVHLLSQLPQ